MELQKVCLKMRTLICLFLADIRNVQAKRDLYQKFETDVLLAEKLSGGDKEVFRKIEDECKLRRIDYSTIGFGAPKPKKKKDEVIYKFLCMKDFWVL